MRGFFRAFSLLHRRSRSEPIVTMAEPPPAVVQEFDVPAFVSLPRKNKHVRHSADEIASDARWLEYHTALEKTIELTRSQLSDEIKKNAALQRTVDEQTIVINDLRRVLEVRDRTIKSLKAPAIVTSTSGTLPQPLLPPTGEPAAPVRTMDEYNNLVQTTLDTRNELRTQRKICKFWKRKAQEAGVPSDDLITPSGSAVSSIFEVISAERQSRVDRLAEQRRKLSMLDLSKTQNTDLLTPDAACPPPSPPPTCPLPSPPRSTSPVPTLSPKICQLSIAPKKKPTVEVSLTYSTFEDETLDTSASLPRLAPLASQSFKAEMNLMFGISESPSTKKSQKKRLSLATNASNSSVYGLSDSSQGSDLLNITNEIESFGDLKKLVDTTLPNIPDTELFTDSPKKPLNSFDILCQVGETKQDVSSSPVHKKMWQMYMSSKSATLPRKTKDKRDKENKSMGSRLPIPSRKSVE